MKPAELPRLLRTLRHIPPKQLTAQLRHVFADEGRPGVARGEALPLAVDRVHAPFLPAPPHAHFDGDLGFELIARSHRFASQIDWQFDGHGPLWSFHLHQFDWARDASLSPAQRTRVILDWIDRCDHGFGWAPHPISLRLLSWGKLLLTPGMLALDETSNGRVRASLAQQAETLSQRLEVRLQANHLLSNLLGVVFAGLMFEGGRSDHWRSREAWLRREIERQILPDGSHIERSPMYHGLLLENLLDLLNLARTSPRTPAGLVDALVDATARMRGAHRVWTHPDDEIAQFGDSAFDIAHPPRVLEQYASALAVEARAAASGQLDDAGIYRFQAGPLLLLVTTGPPSPAYQPGHAHCDALSFELSIGLERVVRDTGVYEYVPGTRRDQSRTTASHATVHFVGREQSEIWSAHRVGGRAVCAVLQVGPNELRARCTPWFDRGVHHERHFRIGDGVIEIEDEVSGAPGELEVVLPLGEGTLELDAAAGNATFRLPSGRRLGIELPESAAWSVERRPWFPRFGEAKERDALVGKTAGAYRGRIRIVAVQD